MVKTLHTIVAFLLVSLVTMPSLSAQVECGCTNCPVQITDNDTFEAYINVSIDGSDDLGDCQLEQVCFTITHTWVGDLAATLTSPSGLSYIIMGDNNNNFGGCGTSSDDIDICITTGTGNPLTNNTAYMCNGGAGQPCLVGDWTVACGGVTDPVTGALEAPNCDLDDFNVPGDPVNGTWTLTINDICGADEGPLEDWSLVFSCPVLECISCEPEGGSIPSSPIVICDGDLSLDLPPSGHQTDSDYGYTYIISESDVVVDVNDIPDLSGLPPGEYEVCGFSYALSNSGDLFDLIGESLSSLQSDFSMTPPPFCADFSDNCVDVSIGEPLDVEIDGPDFVCENAEVELTVIGGPFSDIQWSTGESSETISVDAGTYSVTVQDDAGCESMAEFTVDQFPTPEPQIIGPDEICEGAEGLLETTEDYESYMWSTGEETASILVSESGGYEVTVTDINGCEGFANFVLQVSNPVEVQITGDLQICGDGGETLLDAGPGFATYEWSTGETSQDILVDFPDMVSVTVTNDIGCEGTDEVTVELFDTPEAEIMGPEAVCIGESITLTVTPSFSSYSWSNFASTQSTEVDAPGIYTVTVTDNNGCEAEAEFEVIEGLAVDAEVMGDLVFCQGTSTTLTITPGYDSYQWSHGPTDNEVTITLPDDYTVTVTSVDGCEQVLDFTVVEISTPNVSIDGDPFLCEGESTTLTTGSFATYEWSTGDTGFEITVSETDTYILTVTDDNGCEAITSFDVVVYPLPEAEITGPDALCAGENTMLTVTETFSDYQWSNALSGQSISVDAPGIYMVTVTDNNGCEAIAEFEIFEGEPVDAEVSGNLSYCTDGSTVLTITPGYASYVWSNSLTGNQQTIDVPGDYTVTVTSVDGCSDIVAFTVEELDALNPMITGDAAICEGATSTLSLPGTYESYLWSTASTDPTIDVTTSGTYSVTVTDASGCEGEASFAVTVNTPVQIAITGDAEICDDGDGALTATAGFATYEWSTTDDTQVITVTSPGTYTVEGTDANGCSTTASFEVAQVASPNPTISGDLTVCPGSTTVLTTEPGFDGYTWSVSGGTNEVSGVMPGTVTVTVTNATGCTGEATVEVAEVPNPEPEIVGDLILCEEENSTLSLSETYEAYQWSDSSTDPTITVEEGTFGVTVTDDEGCMGSTSATLEEVIPTVAIAGDADFCIGETTTLSVPDNFADYAWSTGDTGSSITTTPGTTSVMVTVTDENGCTAEDEIELTEFPLPEVEITGRLSFCPAGGTELTATAGFVSYAWSNMESTSTISTNIEGTYSVTVTDGNGCQNTASVDIVEDSELDPIILGELEFCAGLNTTLTVPDDYATYNWSHGPMDNEVVLTEPGDYTVTVADEFGCMGTSTVAVAQNELPTPTISGELDYCIGDSTSLNGGSGYESYAWSDGTDTQLLTVDSPGDYGLTVTDDNGCVGATSADIVENELPVTTILGEPGFCPGLTTVLTAEDGFVAYEWSTSANGTSIEVGTPETFSLSVTDENGCVGVTSQLVEEYATTVPDINGEAQFCPGASTTLTAGTGFENYNWSNGSMDISVDVDQETTITLDVTDTNGCVTSNSVDLSNFVVTPPTIDAPDGFCAGNTADLTATPGYASYLWSNDESAANITVNGGGVYELDVVDTNGCPSSAVVSVDEYDLPVPAIGGSLTFCVGNSTQLNAGATYATYAWSNGSEQPEVTIDAPGDVSLTVTDVNGCVGSTTEFVNEATELSPSISGELEYCAGLSTTLSAGSGFATYEWSTGEMTSEITVEEPGIYTVNVTDSGGCAGTGEVEVLENALPLPEITGELDYCAGLSTELTATPGFASYEWSTTAPTGSITVNTPGNYSVTVTDENDCVNFVSTTVSEQALPAFTIVGPTDFCVDSFTVLSVEPAFATYEWSVGSDEQQVQVSNGGTVGVTVTDSNGCISSDAQAVATVPLPLADAGAPQDLDCEILSVSIGGVGSTTGGEFSYQWTGPGITADNMNEAMPDVEVEGTYTLQILNETYGCLSPPSEVAVTDVSYTPQVIIEVVDILDCATATVQIDARDSDEGTQYVYQWYDGDLNPIPGANTLLLTVGQAQFYTLEIIDTLTGCDNTGMVEVTENELYPLAEAGLEQLITCGEPIVTLNGTDSQMGGQIVYEWTTPDGNILGPDDENIAQTNEPGWYYLLVSDTQNGCSNIDSVFVDQDTDVPVAQTSGDFELDCIFPNTTLSGAGSSLGSNFTYQWLLNGSPVADAGNLQLNVEAPGTYTLVVTDDDNECSAQDQVEITLNAAVPQALSFVTDTPTCAGDDDGGIIIAGVEGGTPPFSYSVGGAPYTSQTNYNELVAGNYEVVVEDATGCLLQTTITVPDGNDLFLDLGEDQFLKEGELADIYPESGVDSTGLVRIDWLTVANLPCPDCYYQLDLALDQSTQFFLEIQDENGCVAKDDVTIYIDKERNVYVPNAFSPDGEGDNNIFYIFSDDSVEEINTFQVFNRWGESVFEIYGVPTNDPDYGWDGLHRGQPVNAAVYVWFAEIKFKNGDVVVFKGDVVIMR